MATLIFFIILGVIIYVLRKNGVKWGAIGGGVIALFAGMARLVYKQDQQQSQKVRDHKAYLNSCSDEELDAIMRDNNQEHLTRKWAGEVLDKRREERMMH